VRDATAFLVTMTTRLSINATQTARARRETYVGPWLPEPIDTRCLPPLGAERGEALEMAVLMLLEQLAPTERAVFVLRAAFDYPYDKIAEIVGTSDTAARKQFSRARQRVAEHRRQPVDPALQRRLLAAFLDAARGGDVTALERLFAADVASYSDGNGIRGAARMPVLGREKLAKVVAAYTDRFWVGADVSWVTSNGAPALLLTRDGVPAAWLSVRATDDGIDRVFWVLSPPKLGNVGGPPTD
jgi:RNA polymerase sigma-70 factor, ECF subfamily